MSLFYCLHSSSICMLVQLLVKYGNYSNKRRVYRCGVYKGGTYLRKAFISMWIPKGEVLIRERCLIETRCLLQKIRSLISKTSWRRLNSYIWSYLGHPNFHSTKIFCTTSKNPTTRVHLNWAHQVSYTFFKELFFAFAWMNG